MKRAAAQVGGAAIVVAIVGYFAQFFAARWLGPAHYTDFAVFWALLFIVVGSLSGITQEVIRVSRVAKLRLDAGAPVSRESHQGPRISVLALWVSAGLAALTLISGLAWGPLAFGSNWFPAVALLSLAGLLVGGGLTGGAHAAGFARWRLYSLLVVLEGVARLSLFLIAAFLAPTVLGFSIAAVLAFLPQFLVALLWRPLREQSFSVASDSPVRESMARILRAMGASSLSSVLLIGWPVLLAAASSVNPRGSDAASLGTLILLLSLTRAPIMVPLNSFQNALVARFTGLDLASRRAWVARGTGIVLLSAGVLAALAALWGPPLLLLFFGADYRADSATFAALTAASAGLGIITLTGTAALSTARHGLYLLGWGVAITSSLVILLVVALPFTWATVLAVLVGPIIGAVVHAFALLTPRVHD